MAESLTNTISLYLFSSYFYRLEGRFILFIKLYDQVSIFLQGDQYLLFFQHLLIII